LAFGLGVFFFGSVPSFSRARKRGEDEDILKVLCEIDVRIHSGMTIWLCFAAFAGFIAPLFLRRFLSVSAEQK